MTSSPLNPGTRSHDAHDRTAIAALAADDLKGSDRTRAMSVLAGCTSCEQLHVDLRLIAVAVGHLSPAVLPPGRSFQLSPADAQRINRRNRPGFLRSLGSARGSLVRPLAGALMTLGLAGFILSTQPLIQFGATTAAPRDAAVDYRSLGPPVPTSAPGGLESVGKALGGASAVPTTGLGGRPEATPSDARAAFNDDGVGVVPIQSISWPLVSAAAFLAGVTLLVLRQIAVRFH